MPRRLPQIQRQLEWTEQDRRILERVARVDPPAAVRADMHRAVVAIDRDHLVRRVRPSLRVVELGRVRRAPVAGVDQLLAAQLLAQVALALRD